FSVTSTKPGLLTKVTSFTGLQTTLKYDTIRNSSPLVGFPLPGWVVSQLQTTNGLTGSLQGRTATTQYSYESPIYDARDKAFVGFKHVAEITPAETGIPGHNKVTVFATDACQLQNGAQPTPPNGTACYGSEDYSYYRLTRGLPVVVMEQDDHGTLLRSVRNVYKWNKL